MKKQLYQSLQSSLSSGILILKLVIPFYILADILLYFDLLRPVSQLFLPVTSILQLPAETAMAITAGIFLNLYAAVAFAAPPWAQFLRMDYSRCLPWCLPFSAR